MADSSDRIKNHIVLILTESLLRAKFKIIKINHVLPDNLNTSVVVSQEEQNYVQYKTISFGRM